MYVQMHMTGDPVTIPSDCDIAEAVRIMKKHDFRRLPVVDAGKLTGLVTLHGLYRALPENINPARGDLPETLLCGTLVREVMSDEVITAEPTEPLEEAAERMRRHKIGGMPVVRRGEVVGVITESDIFRAFMQLMGAGLGGIRISFDVSPQPATLHKVLQTAGVYGVKVNSLTMCRTVAHDRVTFTMRIEGQDVNRFVASLWKSGYRVVGVRRDEDAEEEAP